MRRRGKKRIGRPARRREVDQAQAAVVQIVVWPAALKYTTTPRKLRGKDGVFIWLVRDAIRLSEDYPHYFELTFWLDLQKRGVDFPFYLPHVLHELSCKPSEFLRAIADYIDAYRARKGNRGARLKATEKLYDYAQDVMLHEAKELNWREIRERYCPDYPPDGDGSYRNFQKFLRERGIPFQPVGEFRGRPRKCVRKQKKDTQLPLN
jgi:hypothetical protein